MKEKNIFSHKKLAMLFGDNKTCHAEINIRGISERDLELRSITVEGPCEGMQEAVTTLIADSSDGLKMSGADLAIFEKRSRLGFFNKHQELIFKNSTMSMTSAFGILDVISRTYQTTNVGYFASLKENAHLKKQLQTKLAEKSKNQETNQRIEKDLSHKIVEQEELLGQLRNQRM